MATGANQLIGTQSLSNDVDVAIIGNGPSAIALSFLLSGYRPYWNGTRHPNQFLASKLPDTHSQSLLDQDLEFLSEGLTGRSNNPISLLFDHLLQPNADLGLNTPPAIEWRYHKELAIDHVVLGRGCVGGSWNDMPSDLQSLSYAQWLQLPDMPVSDYISEMSKEETAALERGQCGVIAQYYQHYVKRKGLHGRFVCGAEVTHVRRLEDASATDGQMASLRPFLPHCVSPVASCCTPSPLEHKTFMQLFGSDCSSAMANDCPSLNGFSPHRVPSSTISEEPCLCMSSSSSDGSLSSGPVLPGNYSSRSMSPSSLEDKPVGDEADNGRCTGRPRLASDEHLWSLSGTRRCRPFHFCAKHLVLAVGTSDEPRRLNVPGEDLDILSYGCPTPEKLRSIAPSVDAMRPVVVVGCGLTAADTVILALQYGLPVVHVFARAVADTSLVLNRMPPSVYPEYVRVSKLMQAQAALVRPGESVVFNNEEPYVSLPFHHVLSLAPGVCTLQDAKHQREVSIPCSYVFVAAGSRPNLSFLSHSGQDLLFSPSTEFQCRTNPLVVDPVSFESKQVRGLYAMGPLVGDNFVRFAIGASLGIGQALASKLRR